MDQIELNRIIDDVMCEYDIAVEKFGAFNSPHEAYAVLLEEVDEFWGEVKKQSLSRSQKNIDKMRHELKQIAAMAIRAIVDLEG